MVEPIKKIHITYLLVSSSHTVRSPTNTVIFPCCVRDAYVPITSRMKFSHTCNTPKPTPTRPRARELSKHLSHSIFQYRITCTPFIKNYKASSSPTEYTIKPPSTHIPSIFIKPIDQNQQTSHAHPLISTPCLRPRNPHNSPTQPARPALRPRLRLDLPKRLRRNLQIPPRRRQPLLQA